MLCFAYCWATFGRVISPWLAHVDKKISAKFWTRNVIIIVMSNLLFDWINISFVFDPVVLVLDAPIRKTPEILIYLS